MPVCALSLNNIGDDMYMKLQLKTCNYIYKSQQFFERQILINEFKQQFIMIHL